MGDTAGATLKPTVMKAQITAANRAANWLRDAMVISISFQWFLISGSNRGCWLLCISRANFIKYLYFNNIDNSALSIGEFTMLNIGKIHQLMSKAGKNLTGLGGA
jgi:hypothetical protein